MLTAGMDEAGVWRIRKGSWKLSQMLRLCSGKRKQPKRDETSQEANSKTRSMLAFGEATPAIRKQRVGQQTRLQTRKQER